MSIVPEAAKRRNTHSLDDWDAYNARNTRPKIAGIGHETLLRDHTASALRGQNQCEAGVSRKIVSGIGAML